MTNHTTPASPLSRPDLTADHGDECDDCHASLDDGPHGLAHVEAVVSVDGVSCCVRCALARGATYREIAAAMGCLGCEDCGSQLDVQDPQVRWCVGCSVAALSEQFPIAELGLGKAAE